MLLFADSKAMSVAGNILFVLMLLAGIMTFLTYSPSDYTYFWTYWVSADSFILCRDLNDVCQCVMFAFFFFGYLLEKMFCADLTFVFDPNTDNWRRKTDPQS